MLLFSLIPVAVTTFFNAISRFFVLYKSGCTIKAPPSLHSAAFLFLASPSLSPWRSCHGGDSVILSIANDDDDDDDDDDDYNDDDDIYIMVECILSVCHKSHYFQVATSWIADDDDIYIMVECIYLSCLSHLPPTCRQLPFGNAADWKLIIIILSINHDNYQLWIANICLIYLDSQKCLSVCHKLLFPSELSAAGAKRGVRSFPMRTVPSRRST